MESDGGWIGTPDPTKFAPGTTALSDKELKEEVEKGNVVLWKDFKQQLASLGPEEREALANTARKKLMQERMFVTLKDGSKVALWDLLQYVESNPELKELAERRRRIPTVDPEDPAGGLLPAPPASGLDRSVGLPIAVMDAREAQALEADWGHVAHGSIWRRRPTRWLLGWDGVKDWDVDVYAHEAMANQVLGRKYGGRDPSAVIADPDYARDVLRCGPLLGVTFVLTAARDMQLKDVASSWQNLLSSYLQRQAPLSLPKRLRPTEVDPTDLNAELWMQRLEERRAANLPPTPAEAEADGDPLGVCWRTQAPAEHSAAVRAAQGLLAALPEALCPPGQEPAEWPLAKTKLVDQQTKRTWRQGGALWVTLEPEGKIMVQAQSGGLVGEQESYLIGSVEDQEAMAGALMDAFLGPRPVDPDMAAAGRAMLLLPANGFTAGNLEGDPNHPGMDAPAPDLPRLRRDPSAFKLQPLGGGAGPRTVLSGIRDMGAAPQVLDLIARAASAAEDAAAEASSSGADSAAASARAREAAARMLREGYDGLAPEARGMVLREAQRLASPAGNGYMTGDPLAADLFSLARKLDGSDDEDS
ncbi:hypothetical protein HYH03_011619 [Edaphochlamys debaryana]|uniref:Uncharacterized protein n=1 Tax=Edaphochlamys debaryana TaxID=47281 RepID=A0A835XUI2_9CHLO|nr:hypothetical protein HYH03_011619 [Edaphochlamys debaryana]|eukprot:KAG2489990.1 hypothetical protein HYH03_011619 [Edaphochlamys debaryana]